MRWVGFTPSTLFHALIAPHLFWKCWVLNLSREHLSSWSEMYRKTKPSAYLDCISSQPKNKCTFSRSRCQCMVSSVYRIYPPSERGLACLGHLLPNQGGASRQRSMLLKHIRTPDFLAVAHWKKFISQFFDTRDRSTLRFSAAWDTPSGAFCNLF